MQYFFPTLKQYPSFTQSYLHWCPESANKFEGRAKSLQFLAVLPQGKFLTIWRERLSCGLSTLSRVKPTPYPRLLSRREHYRISVVYLA